MGKMGSTLFFLGENGVNSIFLIETVETSEIEETPETEINGITPHLIEGESQNSEIQAEPEVQNVGE